MLALACSPLVAAPVGADEILEYLDSHGLSSLAALRLETLANAASGEEKAQLLDRLAELFARALDDASDPAAQARLLVRADELADKIQSAKGDLLRVAAARARYRSAARVAESIRAGMPGDADGAVALLTQQIDTLLEVSARAEKRSSDLDRRLDASDGMRADAMQEARERENAIAGVSRYLAAWSLVYRGFLRDDPRDADRAAGIFLPLLGAREGKLTPGDVSEPLRADELYASSILGLALAKAPSGGYAEAQRWLELLDHRETFAPLRESRAGWSMVAAVEARAYAAARENLAKLSTREDAANWARVAAARSIERSGGVGASDGGAANNDARLLLRESIALLAAKRDLNAIRELVKKYGESILGDDAAGFVPSYVKAVRFYDEAQSAIAAAGTDNAKLESAAVSEPSKSAADALGAALAAADAATYPEAVLSCRLMRAWSLRGAGLFREASEAFEQVSADSVGDRAEEAARMGILSLDDARRKARDADTRKTLDESLMKAVDVFLARFPSSDHVPELLVRKVSAMAEPTVTDVGALLQVRPGSKEFVLSRRQALDALYRAFRVGKDPREEVGKQYASVLAELTPDPETGLPASSSVVARQSLEVLLAPEVRAVQTAMQMIAALEKAGAVGKFDIREADEELGYRRLQIAMLSDRWADVEPALAPFEKPEATKLWADAALRLAVRGGESKRRAVASDAPERGAYVSTIVRAGDAIFVRAGGLEAVLAGTTPEAAQLMPIAMIVLDARAEMVRSNASIDEAKRGLAMVEPLLKKRPSDGNLLRLGAMFAEGSGDYARAAEMLRTLVGGLPERSEPWFAAKVDQIRVLAKLSPERARVVLSQFRTLYPDLGPEPHRSRIVEIERTLPPEAPKKPSEPAASTAPAAPAGGTP